MKKVLVLLLALTLTFSMSLSSFGASDKSNNGNGKGSSKSTVKSEKFEKSDLQKQFKQELNQAKKGLAAQKSDLEAKIVDLQAQYDALLASTPADDAAAAQKEKDLADLQLQIAGLDADKVGLQTEMKRIINERYMITKTMYSGEELAQFDSAAALIEQMYADASVMEAWSVTVHNNLVKFEAPPYIKGGKIMFPLKAIATQLGAECVYDPETRAVSITKDGTTMVFTIDSAIATITQTLPAATTEEEEVVEDGVTDETITDDATVDETITEPVITQIDMLVPAKITCGRTYIPLKALADAFGLEAVYDADTETVEVVDEVTTEETPTDTTGDTTGGTL
ncbi:MAG: stalk domain-containing protein [Syntrophomonas sp.]|nr:stalk domain-containing protein [Syntrophomonas sp.]